MPLLFGPKNSRYTYTGTPCPHNDLAFASDAKTLSDAIQQYEEHFKVVIQPCTEPLPGETDVKYFSIRDIDSADFKLVDIHIIRGAEIICPKQDVTFGLIDSDLVEMGELIC
jgi:hypothetical protein